MWTQFSQKYSNCEHSLQDGVSSFKKDYSWQFTYMILMGPNSRMGLGCSPSLGNLARRDVLTQKLFIQRSCTIVRSNRTIPLLTFRTRRVKIQPFSLATFCDHRIGQIDLLSELVKTLIIRSKSARILSTNLIRKLQRKRKRILGPDSLHEPLGCRLCA